jgi:hypothetical protein
MIEATFQTPTGDGDMRDLATVKLSVLPRKGERVILDGPEFGSRGQESETYFVVTDVVWHLDRDGEGPTVFVWLDLDEHDEQRAYFRPRCTCAVPDSLNGAGEPIDHCRNCDGRLP